MSNSPNPIFDESPEQAQKPVSFSVVWKGMAVAGFMMMCSICLGLLTWGTWVTYTVNDHSTQIAVLRALRPGGQGVSQSVNVGDAGKLTNTEEESARTWLTVQEVAKREHVTERSVLNYIESGMIEPLPVKEGKSWVIAEHYRIVPKDSEGCGNTPNPNHESTP